MAIIHIDYTNGDDTTGDGSSGTPYKTLTKAFAVLTNADSIKIANTSAQQESNLAFPALSFTAVAPLIIEGWDNGGALVINTPSGTFTDCGVIENSGTTNPVFSNTIQHIRFIRIKIANFNQATNAWATTKSLVNFYNCVIDDCASFGSGSGNGWFINCAINATNAGYTWWTTGFQFIGCYVYGAKGIIGNYFFNNIFDRCVTSAINSSNNNIIYIINNTFIGNNYSNTTADRAILVNNTAGGNLVIINNHFQNYGTGANSWALDDSITVSTSRGTITVLGGNSFYNVTNKYNADLVAATILDLTADDIDESADPLVDAANLDFRKKTTALSYDSNPAFTGYLETITPSGLTTGGPQNVPVEGASGGYKFNVFTGTFDKQGRPSL